MGAADAGYPQYESWHSEVPYTYDDSGLERRISILEKIISQSEHKLETGDPEKDMVLYDLSGNYDKLRKAVNSVTDKYFSEGRYNDITKLLPQYLRYEDAKKKFVDAAYGHIDSLLAKEEYSDVKHFLRQKFSFQTEYKYSKVEANLSSMDKERYEKFSQKTLEDLKQKYQDAERDAEYYQCWKYEYENRWNGGDTPKHVREKLDRFNNINRLFEYLKKEDDENEIKT